MTNEVLDNCYIISFARCFALLSMTFLYKTKVLKKKNHARKLARDPYIYVYRSGEQYLCVDVCIGSVLLDELAAWTYILTHEH